MRCKMVRSGDSQSGKMAILAILGVLIIAAVAGLAVMSGKVPGLSAKMGDSAQAQTSASSETADASATKPAGDAAAPAAEEKKAEEVAIRPGNPVVAKVGDMEIKRVDLLTLLQQMPPAVRQAPIQQIYPMLVEQAINSKIIDEHATKASLDKDAKVKEQVELARQQIIRNIFLQKESEKAVSEDKLKAAYDEFIKKQGDVEEIKARHILVDSEDKAKEVISKLASGAKFEDLAKEYSSDGTKDSGGDLGWFAKQEMVPAFSDAAFALKSGETSKTPVKTQFGWHIIMVEDRRVREKPKFDDIKPFLETQLRREALEKMVADWRKDLKIEQFDINGDPVKAEGAEAAPAAPAAPAAAPAPAPEGAAPAPAPAPAPVPPPAPAPAPAP